MRILLLELESGYYQFTGTAMRPVFAGTIYVEQKEWERCKGSPLPSGRSLLFDVETENGFQGKIQISHVEFARIRARKGGMRNMTISYGEGGEK